MYKDIISYELAENITIEKLILIAKEVEKSWMKNQAGFVKWEIHSNKEGHFTDIVYWKSKKDAQDAEKEMGNIPNGAEWFACYKEGTFSSKNLTLIAEF